MSLKLIYFFINFYGMFLTVSALFVCQIMEHSPTLCFAGVNLKKRENKQKTSKKKGNCSSLCHNIVFVCRDTISSRTKELCRS